MEAVLILDGFENSFRYFPEPISPCLMPVGDKTLIENVISWLKRTCVYSLTLVTGINSTFCDFQKYITTISSSLKIHIIEIDRQSNCLGDFIRNISISLNLQNDFLLIYGNTYLCHDLDGPIKQHIDTKAKRPNLEATLILSKILPNEGLRSSNEQHLYIMSNEGRILGYGNLDFESKFGLTSNHLKKYKLDNFSLKLNYDLVNSGILICTNKITEKFKTSFDFKTIEDYINHVTSDELEFGEIFTCILEKPIASECHTLPIADYNIYYQLSKQVSFAFEKFAKFSLIPDLKSITINRVGGRIDNSIVKDCQVSSSALINSSSVYNCKISDNCHVINSVVFNSIIESNVMISNCLVISNCVFKANTRVSGTIVGNLFKLTRVEEADKTDDLANFSLIRKSIELKPPSIYSDAESCTSNSSFSSQISDYGDQLQKNNNQQGKIEDITEFESEVFDMITDTLSNPQHIQYSVLELKGLRFAYNVQNVHMVQALLSPIIIWLSNSYTDYKDWESALENAKIYTIISPFIEEEDKTAHFATFSALLKVCNGERLESDSLRFCYACEAFNGAELLNFDYFPEWYNSLGEDEKGDSSLHEMRFKAFLEWLNE